MKTRFGWALASAMLLGTIGSAYAADMPVKAAPPAPTPARSWTGCYVGGGGGYGMYNQNTQEYFLTGLPDSLGTTNGGRGGFATVQGGCDYQAGQFVIGAFGDYDWASISGTRSASFVTFPFRGDEKLDQAWAFGGRVGWLPSPNFLTYFSGGYTQAHLTGYNLALDFAPAGLPLLSVNSTWRNGWFIGGGYEYALNFLPGLMWKTEYRYADYGSQRDTVFFFGTTTPFEFTNSHKYTQTIRSELVYHFNFLGRPVAAKY